MIIEAILQLDKGLNAANVNKVFNLTLKSFLDRDHSNGLTDKIYGSPKILSNNLFIWKTENAVSAFQDVLYNCSSYPKGIPHNSQYIRYKLEVIPPKNVARLNRNVSEYLHRFTELKPPLWLSDLCAALITVSALFLIYLKCVFHLSPLVYSVHNNQLAQVFHSKVTKLLVQTHQRW